MHERPYWWRADDHPKAGLFNDAQHEPRRGDRPHWWNGRDLPPQDERIHEERRRADSYDAHADHDSVIDAGPYSDHEDIADDRTRLTDRVRAFFGSDRRMAHSHPDDDHYNDRRDFHGVGPHTRHEEDEELRDLICQRLADDPDLDASDVLVRVIDNEAILDGAVRRKRDAQRVYEAALDVPGIVHVRDRLQVGKRGRDRVRRATIGMGYEESRRRLS